MKLLAIDPGPVVSGAVVLDVSVTPPRLLRVWPSIVTSRLITVCGSRRFFDHLAIEMVASYGMPVGASIFETCVVIGRILEAAGRGDRVYRKDVTLAMCRSVRANDSNVRQAIIDMYPPRGGGKTPQIGTKKAPGPLYGVKAHAWAALAVGITWQLGAPHLERLDNNAD